MPNRSDIFFKFYFWLTTRGLWTPYVSVVLLCVSRLRFAFNRHDDNINNNNKNNNVGVFHSGELYSKFRAAFCVGILPQSAVTIFQSTKLPRRVVAVVVAAVGQRALYSVAHSCRTAPVTRAPARYKFSVRHVCFICRAHTAYVKRATDKYIYIYTYAYELNGLNPFLVVLLYTSACVRYCITAVFFSLRTRKKKF